MNFKNKFNNFIKNKNKYTEEIFEIINSKDWKTNNHEKNVIAFFVYLGRINLELINNCFLNLNNILIFYNIKNDKDDKKDIDDKNDKGLKNILKIIYVIENINDIFLQESYKYVMSFESAMIKFIMKIMNEKNIIISKNHPFKLQKKIKNIISKNTYNYYSNNVKDNYFIINKMYFSEMIDFINWLFIEKYIKLSDFENFGFIDKDVSNNYKNKKYKNYEFKNKKIVEEILGYLKITNKYRNIISHNDKHFINKKNINEFISFLNNQEKILKNDIALNLKIEISNQTKMELNNYNSNKSLISNFSLLFK